MQPARRQPACNTTEQTGRTEQTGPRHHSQHDRAHTRYLEHRRNRLVRELAAVNAELRRARPAAVREVEDDWDCDPRVECGL